MIDYSISIGNIIEIGSIVGGGLLVLITLRSDVSSLKDGAKVLKEDLDAMQAEIKKLGDILVNLADIRGEIRVHDTRITAIEQDIREMRNLR
jgi:predicted  nucleic acid-binding Zn-ribbon protein